MRCDNIVNYMTNYLAEKLLELKLVNVITTCNCKPATTCTSTGCFITNKCISLKCTLFDDKLTLDEVYLKFRIVESLGKNNQIIIGLADIRRYDLATKFRHLLVDEGDDVRRSNSSHSANAEAVRESSLHSDPEAFSARVNTLRRGLLPPHLQKDLITRGGKRSDNPRIPHRYSKRLLKGVVPDSSPSEDLSPGFSCLTSKDLQPFNGKSMNELMTNVLIEGTLFNKNELLDIENDDDNIDEFVDETPYDQLFNEVESGDNERVSSEDKNLQNM